MPNKDDVETKSLSACMIALILVVIFAAFAFVGEGDYRDAVEKERAVPKQLNCATAEECEARIAAGLPLWKEEGK